MRKAARAVPWASMVATAAVVAGCGGRTDLALEQVREDASVPGSADADSGPPAPRALIAGTADPNGPCYMNLDLVPPDVVFVMVASQPVTCGQMLPPSFPDGCSAPFEWEACLPLPLSLLTVGTIDIAAHGIVGFAMNAGGCSGICCSGGAIFDEGTLDITALDASMATFTLTGTVGYGVGGTVMADGTYAALRCP